MKYYNSQSDGNEMSISSPVRYFNLAIEQIDAIEEWLRTAKENVQPLLVHIDIYIYMSKKYPEIARRRIAKLDVVEIKETFYAWYERCEKKIPAAHREGVKQNADLLFEELEILKKEKTV